MAKVNVSISYKDIPAPTEGATVHHYRLRLLQGGSPVAEQNPTTTAVSAVFDNVPPGTGYAVDCQAFDAAGNGLGELAISAAFNIGAGTITVPASVNVSAINLTIG